MIWDKLQKLSPRERGMLALGTVALLVAVGNWLVVQPTLNRLRDIDEEIDKKTELCRLNRGRLTDELLVHEEFRSASELLAGSASSAEEIENLKEKVGNMAGQAGVALDSISHREPAKAGQCDEYQVEISKFRAKMPALLKFLHELSVTEGMFRVSRLSIRPKPKSDMVEGALSITRVAVALGDESDQTAAQP